MTPLNTLPRLRRGGGVAKQALKELKTIREVVIERGYVDDGKLTEAQLDEALDVLRMARGGK